MLCKRNLFILEVIFFLQEYENINLLSCPGAHRLSGSICQAVQKQIVGLEFFASIQPEWFSDLASSYTLEAKLLFLSSTIGRINICMKGLG